MVKRIAPMVVMLSLVFLFVYPARRLHDFSKVLISGAEECIDEAQGKRWAAVTTRLEGMYAQFLQEKSFMHLFLDHEEVLELETSLRGALGLSRAEDLGQLILELEIVVVQSQYLDSIENFSFFTLF